MRLNSEEEKEERRMEKRQEEEQTEGNIEKWEDILKRLESKCRNKINKKKVN